MTLGSSDLQSDSNLDSIRNSCDVFLKQLLKKLRRRQKKTLQAFVNGILVCWVDQDKVLRLWADTTM